MPLECRSAHSAARRAVQRRGEFGQTVTTGTAARIDATLERCRAVVDRALDAELSRAAEGAPARLIEAMRYSALGGGKRLRPALVVLSCEACGGDTEAAVPAAVAIECVHAFSLIHDDLPAMDDDDLRRGRPTNHRLFGEALAILAGDALLARAFDVLANQPAAADVSVRMAAELAAATGAAGMIGGQAEDIDGEGCPAESARVQRIHELKTARLFRCGCRLGALAAGAPPRAFDALTRYGHELGLAFQISDDLLDLTATTDALGKRSGKDAAAGKQTFPTAVGVEESRRLAGEHADRARSALLIFGSQAATLSELAEFVVRRPC